MLIRMKKGASELGSPEQAHQPLWETDSHSIEPIISVHKTYFYKNCLKTTVFVWASELNYWWNLQKTNSI